MDKKNILYFGSPAFSAKILEELLKNPNPDFSVVGVVTQPDKPLGRKLSLTPSRVADVAEKYDLPIFKPHKLDEDHLAHIKLLKPDYFLVVSYGKIIPDNWLNSVKKALNIHFSLLPKYRGALCLQETLKNGDSETGVTLMEMSSKLDAGDLIFQQKINIDINDNILDLTNKLIPPAINLINSTLPLYINQKINPKPQDETQAVYTPSYKSLTKQAAFVPWDQIKNSLTGKDPLTTHNLIRSLNPEPGAWTKINNIEVKIIRTRFQDNQLLLETVQMAGKSPISWKQFVAGHPIS